MADSKLKLQFSSVSVSDNVKDRQLDKLCELTFHRRDGVVVRAAAS